MSDVMLQTWVAVQTWLSTAKDAVFGDEEGQGMVEYALILFLVSVVAIAILTQLGTAVNNVFTQALAALGGAGGGGGAP